MVVIRQQGNRTRWPRSAKGSCKAPRLSTVFSTTTLHPFHSIPVFSPLFNTPNGVLLAVEILFSA